MFVLLSCGDDGAREHDEARFVPEDVSVSALPGGSAGLTLIAFTLQAGASGPELYVAVRNEGERPACSAAISVELFDQAEQSLGSGIGGLLTARFYRRTDGSDAVAACIAPGDVSVASVLDLPPELAIEDVRSLVYHCPHFALDVMPGAGLELKGLKRVPRGAGSVYTGALVNGFGVAVQDPSVTVFALNGVGRPLGVTESSGSLELAPGERWQFETELLTTSGKDYVVYPAGALTRQEDK